jgi:type III secretory pathway component EscT
MSALKQKIETQTLQQNVLVCRPQYKAFIQAIDIEELEWLTLISKEISIGKSLDAMVNTNFDFAHWLPVALERNLISTVYKQ